jgi:hypothetical protein
MIAHVPHAPNLAPPVKIGVAAAVTAGLGTIMWAAILLGQVSGDGSTLDTFISGGALTSTAGCLAWVVKQIVSGKLVHRDPETATRQLSEALQTTVGLADRLAEIDARSAECEARMVDALIRTANAASKTRGRADR